MGTKQEPDQNQVAFRRLKPSIDQSYPHGRFVAIDEGRVVADAATFEELSHRLDALGKDSAEILVFQAGVDYPENVSSFSAGAARRETRYP